MLNKVLLIGNLTRDVELRYTPNGAATSKIGLATNRKWKDKVTGESREEAMFVDVTLFGRTAEIANQYLKKGSRVFIEGRLQLERWTDQNGQNRQKHSVVAEAMQFMDTKSSGSNSGGNDYSNEQDYKNDFKQESSIPPIEDSDLPF